MKILKSLFNMIGCIIILIMALTGCGRNANQTSEEGALNPTDPVQWKTQGFTISKAEETESELNISEYIPWEHDTVLDIGAGGKMVLVDSGSYGGLVWQLSRVTEQDRHREYVLELYDVFAKESTVKRFSCEQLGLESTEGVLRGMDMIDGEHYVFQWTEAEYDEEGFMTRRTADRMIYTDLAGEVSSVDLLPSYLEKGLLNEDLIGMNLYEGNCDGKGNTYVLASSEERKGYGSIYFFDRSGSLFLEYQCEQFETVNFPLRTQEGELIFPVVNSQKQQIEYLWADTENGRMCSMAVEDASSSYIYRLYGMQGNEIYYNKDNKEIVSWNIESGERIKILDLPKNGLAADVDILMAFGQEGEYPVLCLRDRSYQRDWFAALTDREIKDQKAIELVSLAKRLDSTENPVADSVSFAANRNRNFLYSYEDASAQEARTRVLADLSNGNGPDLMYVSLEDMRMLEEKGALLDMRELLSPSDMEKMLPGALELGTVNGRLVGLPVSVSADTLMIAEDTWSEASWTLEDVIGLMEAGALEGAIYYNNGYFYPLATVKWFTDYSLADSFLIDWENRKCHFDDERFIRLLELTSTNGNETSVETDTRLNGGKRISLEYVNRNNANLFDVDRERENGSYVGFPTDGDCGNYLTTEGVIVVNAAVENKEAVRAYLEVFCSDKFQSSLSTAGILGINPDMGYKDEDAGTWIWINREEVAIFSDGTSAIDRANSFLRQCVAAPPRYTALEEIIAEELNIMYEQNRNPEDVAKIIHNRVQLYLDEGE